MVNSLRSCWLMVVGGAVFLCASAFGQNCSVATLKGSYGMIQRGTIPGGASLVSVGLVVFDGQGGFTTSGTDSINGAIFKSQATGTYQVNPDCTSRVTVQLQSGPQIHIESVIVDNGKEVFGIGADPGISITSILKRI